MKRQIAAVFSVAVAWGATALCAHASDVVAEWAIVKAPPPPALKPVTVDPKTTALLMLDFLKQNCGQRERCVATVPAVKTLLDRARAAKATVIYSFFANHTAADILDKGLAPVAGEASVTTSADKFLHTDLEKMLRDKGIKTVITVGTSANGAVLYTGSAAGLRGFDVIVPVDGISSEDAYSEQFSTWQLANGPTFSKRVTITRIDMVKF
ncbi:MAG TPA: isochorismatase family protein [Xanthobacteraceae bacterium]|nr:isochorismatase family protein [Xanthobacteraceae bacterium]